MLIHSPLGYSPSALVLVSVYLSHDISNGVRGGDSVSFQRPETAQEAVLREIRRQIVSGQLRPGTAILQDALSTTLGVSRVPIREALRILEGEGQVRHKPHYGYYVAELKLADLQEIYHMRELLESAVAVAATEVATDAQINALEAVAQELAETPVNDITTAMAANRKFHFQLFEIAGWVHFQRQIRLLWDASDSYRARYYMTAESRHRADEEHSRIIAAIRNRDADLVVQELNRHRENAVVSLSRMFDAADTQPSADLS